MEWNEENENWGVAWQNLKYAARRGMILRMVDGEIQNIPVEYADESVSVHR
jgi:hypothetical protein